METKVRSGKGYGQEIRRFSSNGKTFFFNSVRARNDRKYIQINALYGDIGKERLTIFADQAIEFSAAVKDSVEKVFEVSLDPDNGHSIPTGCSECGSERESWKVLATRDGTSWMLLCNKKGKEELYCTGKPDEQNLVFASSDDAYDKWREEMLK